MIEFIGSYWNNRVNLLHSLIYFISTTYSLMLLWLPYFFIMLGYKQGAYIALAYPLAYILSGVFLYPIQKLFHNHYGTTFLMLLLINNIGTIWLTQLGDDPS